MHAMRFVDDVNLDIAFLSPSGFSLSGGFTCGNYGECELKALVAKKARFVVMLMEQWKHRERRLLCLGAGAATALMLALFGPDRFVIPAMGLILVLLLGFRPRIEKAWPEEESS